MAASNTRSRLARKLRGTKLQSQQSKALTFSAVLIALAVALITRQASIAMNRTDKVLDCHVTGVVAHHHDESCYDKEGNLVCPLPERDLHVHDDSCYAETRELVCGLEETTGHVHDASCYAEDGTTLVCGLEESEGHVHDDSCYEVTRELVCGQEEVTEEHVHGPGCFVEVAAAMPAQELSHEIKDADENLILRVDVTAPEGALPEGTTMTATWVEPTDETVYGEDIKKAVSRALSKKEIDGKPVDGKLIDQQIVQIAFEDSEGVAVEPEVPVVVTFSSGLLATEDLPLVVNVDDSAETLAERDGKPKAKVLDTMTELDLALYELTKTESTISVESGKGSLYTLTVTTRDQSLSSVGDTLSITMNASAAAGIPAGSTLQVVEYGQGTAEQQAYQEQAQQALDAGDIALARFFDIIICGSDGERIQPSAPVEMQIGITDAPAEAKQAFAVHFSEDESGTPTGELEVLASTEDAGVTTFEAKSLSVYGVVYTKEFHYAAASQIFDYAMEKGDTISLHNLVSKLGIVEEGEAAEFVNHVTSVTCGDDALLAATKVGEDMTKGQFKAALGVESEYHALVSEARQEKMDAGQLHEGDWALVVLRVFDEPQTLDVTMDNGDVFSVQLTDARTWTKVITAGDDTYEVTVAYDRGAKIPANAELKVTEILPGHDDYDSYYQEAADTATKDAADQGVENPIVTQARLFDIEIVADGEKVEPATPVQVNIKLTKAEEAVEPELTSVVHFADEGAEAMALQEPEKAAKADADETAAATEVAFEAESFSVYTVVNVSNFDDTIVNGGPYVLVSGIANDKGDQGWGGHGWNTTDYFTQVINANAMIDEVGYYEYGDETRTGGLRAIGVVTWEEGGVSYAGGSATEWSFEAASGGNAGKYYITVNKNGTKYYVRSETESIFNQSYYRAVLTTDRNQAMALTISPNSDGTVSFLDTNNRYLCNWDYANGGGNWSEWVERYYNFEASNTREDRHKFKLCKLSDEFDSLAATKTSVQNLPVGTGGAYGDRFMIYHKFEDDHGNEALYALASDGSFVRVYDGGDKVYWRKTEKNLYWTCTQEGGYVIKAEDENTYLSPIAHEGSFQTMSTSPMSLTLNGKDNGSYGTAIENWDQAAYDYAGLHVAKNGDVVTLSAGTRGAGTTDEFYIALPGDNPEDNMPSTNLPTTVPTVDSNALGIKITMYDYSGTPNGNGKLDGMTTIVGNEAYTPHEAHSVAKPYLSSLTNGVPVSSITNNNMAGLFPDSTSNLVTTVKPNVNHLFLQSYYDENGTFRYRSEDNYAYLNTSVTQPDGTTNFAVYEQVGTPNATSHVVGWPYYYHGHFMPFNNLDMTKEMPRLVDQYGTDRLPTDDGRTYEPVYGISGDANYYTGMKMEANFVQPRDGIMGNGDDMVFKFTGDDDMWVYIDGVLVLDIGGIHEPLTGTINFATGEVTNPVGSSLYGSNGSTTLYNIFMAAKDAAGVPQEIKDKINSIEWVDVDNDNIPDTFADYTSHSFSAFYMERGAGASNLDLQFNLKVAHPDEFTVTKELPEDVDPDYVNQTYRFRATFKDSRTGDVRPLYLGAVDSDNAIGHVCTAIYYKDRINPTTGQPVPVNVDENGYFTLKPGETAVFKMKNESVNYSISEVGIDTALTQKVEINDDDVTNQISNGEVSTGYAEVKDRGMVVVTNHPDVQDLLITKHISGTLQPTSDENPVFEFQVFLETTDANGVHKLEPYNQGPYYLVTKEGNDTIYWTLTGENNAPESHGTAKTVCSVTGRNGYINSIPPGYTVVIPNLAVGTNFYVTEVLEYTDAQSGSTVRVQPEGYLFDKEELTADTYATHDASVVTKSTSYASIIKNDDTHKTLGKIKADVDADAHVYNKKEGVDITVEKAWDPKPDPTENASVTVELRRYVKKSKGTINVTLKDNNDEPIAGAEYKLVKQGDGAETYSDTGTTVTTDVDGCASVTGLEPGTYKLVQTSTPEGYSMAHASATTETEPFTVQDNVTTAQVQNSQLLNVKPTKGVITVTLTDTGIPAAPIEGATFTLYKNGAATSTTVTTDVNGMASVSDLEPGAYKLVQTSTPEGYEMPSPAPETGILTVVADSAEAQELSATLTNTKLVTAGTLVLTVTDSGDGSGNSGDPIEGATFDLYKDGQRLSSGHTTGADGTITVGNLEAGSYYFVQTGAAEDYKLPATTQTGSQTIIEAPGVAQVKNLTMQNSLLGKGQVTITLKKDSATGDGIANASFQLKQNGTIVDEGVTDANGTLTFNSVYEGSYVVSQVNTGDAGTDYGVASDWEFEVLANSNTQQTASHTFVDTERSILYTLRLQSSSDNKSVEYLYHSGTTVTLTFDNNNQWYNPYHGIKLSGDITGEISENQITFTITMDSDKVVTLTETGNSNWDNVVTNSLKLSPNPETSAIQANRAVYAAAGGARMLSAADLPSRQLAIGAQSQDNAAPSQLLPSAPGTLSLAPILRAANTVTHSDATPAAAPDGYMPDAMVVEAHTLTSADNWEHTFDTHEKYDANGNPYYYYVVETNRTPSDYWVDSYTGDATNEDGTFTITNKRESKGILKVHKTVVGGPSDVATKNFAFTVTNSAGKYLDTDGSLSDAVVQHTIKHDQTITFNDVPIVPSATYTVTELGTEAGGAAQITGYTLTATGGGSVVVLSTTQAPDGVASELTNTYVTTPINITIEKVDADSTTTKLNGAVFQMYRWGENDWERFENDAFDGTPKTGSFTVNETVTISGLTEGRYKISELSAPDGYVVTEPDAYFKVNPGGSVTLTDENGDAITTSSSSLVTFADGKLTIKNPPGTPLPNAGGPGTTALTLAGGALMAMGAIVLARRRQTRARVRA